MVDIDRRRTDVVTRYKGAPMLMPPISRYMTAQPWTIPPGASLARARELMLEHSIRHLPVVDDGKLVGLVSDRDLRQPTYTGDMRVHDVMSEQVLAIDPGAPVDEVADAMSDRKCGSAVVIGPHHVIGIFTGVDACRVLAEVLRHAVA